LWGKSEGLKPEVSLTWLAIGSGLMRDVDALAHNGVTAVGGWATEILGTGIVEGKQYSGSLGHGAPRHGVGREVLGFRECHSGDGQGAEPVNEVRSEIGQQR